VQTNKTWEIYSLKRCKGQHQPYFGIEGASPMYQKFGQFTAMK